MNANRILLGTTAVLILLSAFTYRAGVVRGERFERGQKLLANLNPDEIAEVLITEGEETTHLRRSGDRFVVASADGYPAANESVNRLLRDILEIGLEKRVGRGEELEQELGVVPGADDALEIVLKSSAEKTMVHLVLGESQEDSGGQFVRRIDQEEAPVYLTSSRVYLSTGSDDFLDKEILNVERSDIAAIRGADFAIEDQDGTLELTDVPQGKKANSTKLNQARNILSPLRFDAHHLADAQEVQGLAFATVVQVDLGDDSGYELRLAERDDKAFVTVSAYHNAQQVTIAVDADEAEAREKADVLARLDEVDQFNQLHGSWVYEVTDVTADRIRLSREELLEDA